MALKHAINFSLFMLATVSLNAPAVTAEQVLSRSCSSMTRGDKNYCPYPFELEKSDAKFSNAYMRFKESMNLDGLEGPQTPLEPVQVWGAKYLKSTACEKHNCGNNFYVFMYQPRTGRMVGIYRVIDGGGKERVTWLNTPLTEAEKDVLMTLLAEATR